MKKIALVLAAVTLIAVVSAVANGGTEPEMKPATLISRLKVGQQVRVLNGPVGGFNVEIPNAQYIKSFERKGNNRKYVTSKITEIGADYIVVTSADGTEKTIAIHAIDVITKLPEVKVEADEEPKK